LTDGIKLIVGLGNRGSQYDDTRHNVGFWLVRSLAKDYEVEFRLETKFKALISTPTISEQKSILFLPETFINLSGDPVGKVVRFYKIPVSSILVVHDELDFMPGVVKIKQGGGANGHNGVQNIIDHLGDNSFWRIRIGIGKAKFKDDAANYVLSRPSRSECQKINDAIARAIIVIPKLIVGDFSTAMLELHTD